MLWKSRRRLPPIPDRWRQRKINSYNNRLFHRRKFKVRPRIFLHTKCAKALAIAAQGKFSASPELDSASYSYCSI